MNIKTFYALTAAFVLSLGSLAAVGQIGGDNDNSDTEEGSSSAFSVIDKNGDGNIDENEAASSGISGSVFEAMDANGDGRISQSEYMQYGR